MDFAAFGDFKGDGSSVFGSMLANARAHAIEKVQTFRQWSIIAMKEARTITSIGKSMRSRPMAAVSATGMKPTEKKITQKPLVASKAGFISEITFPYDAAPIEVIT